MCLLIVKPADLIIPDDHLENGWDSNSDGAGFATVMNGRVKIFKGFFKLKHLRKAIKAHERSPMIIHFRWATHGKKNKFNCHPFPLLDGRYAAGHNGVINIQSTEEKSDTAHFMELVLDPALRKFDGNPAHPALRYLIEQALGKSNKVAVLKDDGKHVIYNESAGTWDNGIWYSNDGYQESRWYNASYMSWMKSRNDTPKTKASRTWWEEELEKKDTEKARALKALEIEKEREMFPDYIGEELKDRGCMYCEDCGTILSEEYEEEYWYPGDMLLCPNCEAQRGYVPDNFGMDPDPAG